MVSLTAREEACLYWITLGKTSWETGQILGITERTVNFHIANLCAKLSVCSRQAAIAAAIRLNLLSQIMPTHTALESKYSDQPGTHS